MFHRLVKKQMESSLQEFHVPCSAEVNLPTTRPTDAHVLEDPHLHVPPQQRPLLAANNCTTLSLDGKIWSLLKREQHSFQRWKILWKIWKSITWHETRVPPAATSPTLSALGGIYEENVRLHDPVSSKGSCCLIVVSLMSGWHDFAEALDAI